MDRRSLREVSEGPKADLGAAGAERVADQERQRIERSELIRWGEVLATKLVGGENQTRPGSGTAPRVALAT